MYSSAPPAEDRGRDRVYNAAPVDSAYPSAYPSSGYSSAPPPAYPPVSSGYGSSTYGSAAYAPPAYAASVAPPSAYNASAYSSSTYPQSSSYGGSSGYGSSSGYGGSSSYGSGYSSGGYGGSGGSGGYSGGSSNRYLDTGSGGGYGRSDDKFAQAGGKLNQNMDWQKKTLTSFVKDFYTPAPEVANRDPEIVNQFYADHNLILEGSNIPKPVLKFEESGFPQDILNLVLKQGFPSPTPIQSQGWPMALSGRDMIGISKTGSGKTLAFLLPAMVHINAQEPVKRGHGPICLVLAPTRELVIQIQEECRKFCGSAITHACVYGGESKHRQVGPLRNGVDILVATPGRLIDFLEQRDTNLERVTYLVLDEADCMLDLGFGPQIDTILSQIRPDRQTLLWSATWPQEVRSIAARYTHEAIKVTVGSTNELKASDTITQTCVVLRSDQDLLTETSLLVENLSKSQKQIIVFANTKVECEKLSDALRRLRVPSAPIHGDKSQADRQTTLNDFKANMFTTLVATGVAARGLDIKGVSFVVNMDLPKQMEEYIHRIGRTGRAGARGEAITLLHPNVTNGSAVNTLLKILRENKQEIPQSLYDLRGTSGGSSSRYSRGGFRGGGGGRGGRGGRGGYH